MDANETQRQARNAVRKGTILAINHARALCRVSVGDPDTDGGGLQTNWIPWIACAAGTTRDWLPPTVGEQVVLLCPMGDPAQGVALRGLFSDAAPAPASSPDTHTRVYPDGASIEYDHAAHALKASLPAGATVLVVAPESVVVQTKAATVQAETITLDAQQTTCTGAMTVKGPFAFEAGMTGTGGAGGGATMQIDGAATFTREVTSQGISLPHHKHREQGDGQLVSEPQ
ncbi:baseplate assembly protein [Burkholderia stagnalis]|uniref:phage baseplate assembly protein V n=1 Tax=Burkholderia stagnalis TaxID=1503054 RepID=UPI00075971C8|nr:phage baseplate assembly protein V [Burkholderia stagnalis]AOK51421.1 baseplate assembly protein [Burkholderia stagnalis]KVN73464.1 baseplate assembly protein [Burkholderia stagnalis]KWH43924.1 baseplate assembly protein [Burkholderia stagnalis]KWH54367.1 baseplate assembly protein [Burkholderia stagnalis]KWO32778.1 baseplate assembly protein [Burkholderia stagnalis]